MTISLTFRALRGAALLAAVLFAATPAARAEPHDLALVFDNSGSMKGNDPGFLARKAAQDFIAGLDGDFRVAVIIFDQKVRLAAALTPLDGASRDAAVASLGQVDYRGQYTQTAAALERALYELKSNAREGARRSVVVLTDGIVDTNDKARDTESIRWMRGDLAAEAADLGIRVYGIAFTDNADVMTIQSLAKRTDAEYFRAVAPEDVAGAFARVGELLLAPLPEPAPAPAPAPPPQAAAAQPEPPAVPEAAAAPEPPAVPEAMAAPEPPAVSEPAAAPEPGAIAQAPQPETAQPDTTPAEPEAAALAAAAPAEAPAEPAAAAEPPAAPEPSAPAPPTESAAAPEPAAAPAVPEPAGDDTMMLAIAAVGAGLLVCVVALVIVLRRGKTSSAGSPEVAPARRAAAPVAGAAVPTGAALEDPARATGGTRIPLEQRMVIIGRIPNPSPDGSTQSIVVDRNTIGRQHAVLEFRGTSFWVSDRKSLNGTFVNDQRLEGGEVELKNGDRIRVYDVEFRFEMAAREDDSDRTVMAGAGDSDDERTVMAGGGSSADTTPRKEGLIAAFGGGADEPPTGEHDRTLIFDAQDAPPGDNDRTLIFDAKVGPAADDNDRTLIFDAKAGPPADEDDRTVIFDSKAGPPADDHDATQIFTDRKKK